MAYLGEEIKKLGFGLMRLPKLYDDTIDVEQTKILILHGLTQEVRMQSVRHW